MAVHGTDAAPLDQHLWKDRLLLVSAPAINGAVEEQRRIYQSAAGGMSERQILLIEALGDSERSRQLRTKVSADGKRLMWDGFPAQAHGCGPGSIPRSLS